jgi:hypothetical protein
MKAGRTTFELGGDDDAILAGRRNGLNVVAAVLEDHLLHLFLGDVRLGLVDMLEHVDICREDLVSRLESSTTKESLTEGDSLEDVGDNFVLAHGRGAVAGFRRDLEKGALEGESRLKTTTTTTTYSGGLGLLVLATAKETRFSSASGETKPNKQTHLRSSPNVRFFSVVRSFLTASKE